MAEKKLAVVPFLFLLFLVSYVSPPDSTMPFKVERGDAFNGTHVTLHTGAKIPVVGLGTWKSKPGEVANAIRIGVEAGVRHIDCAQIYGNEKEIGQALKDLFDRGVVKREDLFITSKLWNSFHAAQDVRPALQKTLDDLQLSYLDLYLIHWPHGFERGDVLFPKNEDGTVRYADTHYMESYTEMEKAVNDGLLRHIGLSNFNCRQMTEVYEKSTIKPAVNQCECHPYLNQEPLIAAARKLNVVFTAYSPLGSGDRPWAKPDDPKLLDDAGLKQIGDKYGKTSAQVLIRFQVERGVAVIPKSVNEDRIRANFNVFDFELSEEDMAQLASFNRPWRACEPKLKLADGTEIPRDAGHPLYPFNDPY